MIISEEDKKQLKMQKLAALKAPFNKLDADTKSYKLTKEGDTYDN